MVTAELQNKPQTPKFLDAKTCLLVGCAIAVCRKKCGSFQVCQRHSIYAKTVLESFERYAFRFRVEK